MATSVRWAVAVLIVVPAGIVLPQRRFLKDATIRATTSPVFTVASLGPTAWTAGLKVMHECSLELLSAEPDKQSRRKFRL